MQCIASSTDCRLSRAAHILAEANMENYNGAFLLQKGFGNCNALLMVTPTAELPEAFCQTTCGRCFTMPTLTMTTQSQSRSFFAAPSNSINASSLSTNSIARSRSLLASCTCTDSQPDKTYTCAQQKAFGKCSADFVAGKGHCQTTCGRCTCNPSCKCDDVRPPGSYTCAQQVTSISVHVEYKTA